MELDAVRFDEMAGGGGSFDVRHELMWFSGKARF
jgi:hypothetical protein